MPIDIFDTETSAQDRVFRYPLYERFLWLMVVVAAAVALVFLRQVREFITTEGRRAWLVIGVAAFFLLLTIWMSIRASVSKVIISPVSLKARVFGQGVQRVSWVHIQRVLYKWRPLGHKLVFLGSDGARVSFRSSINGYAQLIGYVRESCPEHVTDQLDDLLGEEEFDEDDDDTEPEEPEVDAAGEPDEKPADAKPAQQPPPVPETNDGLDDEEEEEDDEDSDEEESDADEEDDDEEEGGDEGRRRRRWWWPFGR